jgi:hypothetical protein
MARNLALAVLASAFLAAAPPPMPLNCAPPAYVPGVDAHGRPVVPAEGIAPPVTVEVNPNVVAELRTPGNPVINETMAEVRVNGLEALTNPPPCLPQPRPRPALTR